MAGGDLVDDEEDMEDGDDIAADVDTDVAGAAIETDVAAADKADVVAEPAAADGDIKEPVVQKEVIAAALMDRWLQLWVGYFKAYKCKVHYCKPLCCNPKLRIPPCRVPPASKHLAMFMTSRLRLMP